MRFSKLLTLLLCCYFAGNAQDIHFSQYYASPLTLNPSLIGGFNGDFRVAANYRNQWYFLGFKPSYLTYSGSFDMPLLTKKLRYDRFGVGVMVFNDRAGDGALSNMTVQVGAAYHKALDEGHRFSLALGGQVGITQRRIDFNKLRFASQFDPDFVFDPTLSNDEDVTRSSFIYPDFTVGLLFRARFSNAATGYVGTSMFHLHKPKEYFLNQQGVNENRLNPRYLVHGGVDIAAGEYIRLTPGFLYMMQNTASEFTGGMALGYAFDEMNAFYLGAWVRVFDNDAIVAMLAYEYGGLRVGVSYDINTSDLRLASNNQGAVELSVVYVHGKKPERQISPNYFCPKF